LGENDKNQQRATPRLKQEKMAKTTPAEASKRRQKGTAMGKENKRLWEALRELDKSALDWKRNPFLPVKGWRRKVLEMIGEEPRRARWPGPLARALAEAKGRWTNWPASSHADRTWARALLLDAIKRRDAEVAGRLARRHGGPLSVGPTPDVVGGLEMCLSEGFDAGAAEIAAAMGHPPSWASGASAIRLGWPVMFAASALSAQTLRTMFSAKAVQPHERDAGMRLALRASESLLFEGKKRADGAARADESHKALLEAFARLAREGDEVAGWDEAMGWHSKAFGLALSGAAPSDRVHSFATRLAMAAPAFWVAIRRETIESTSSGWAEPLRMALVSRLEATDLATMLARAERGQAEPADETLAASNGMRSDAQPSDAAAAKRAACRL
jgi:hypothetical protein